MKSLVTAVLVVLLATPSSVLAEAKSDETAIGNLPLAFCNAVNRHDGRALAQLSC
jgi:hypothetical protein